MRVLFANKYFFLKGGAERVMLTEMELLRSQGHEVAVFASQHPSNLPAEYSGLFPEKEDYFNSGFWHKAKAAVKIVYSLETLRKFGKVLDAFKPDIVHAHNIYAQLSTALLDAAKDRGVPVVLTAHDYKVVCPSYAMLDHGEVCEKCLGRKYYHCLLAKCHKENLAASAVYTAESYFNYWFKKYDSVRTFICPSQFMREKMLDRIPPEKLIVIPNPVDLPRHGSGAGKGDYYLFVGRLSKEKGVKGLIEVFRRSGLALKIAGTGPGEAEYRRLAEGAAHIQLLGFKDGEELAALYRGAYACVIPSQWYENQPMSAIEALAYGKPVLAARIGGIPEIIRDGTNGLLFDPFDPADLEAKVNSLQSLSPEDYGRMCRDAGGAALSRFSLERHYGDLMAAYQKALG